MVGRAVPSQPYLNTPATLASSGQRRGRGLLGIFNQNKVAMVLKSHGHGPERGPAPLDDNRGTLTLNQS